MIFSIRGHIDMIRKGEKTQTRRVNRGIYQEWKDYAVQQKRGVKAEIDIRIVMDDIWVERCKNRVDCKGHPLDPCIFIEDAQAEGGYTPNEYEREFKKAYPAWDSNWRWVYEFHVLEVKTDKEMIRKGEGGLKCCSKTEY